MRKVAIAIQVLLVAVICPCSFADDVKPVPDLQFRVAVRQKDNGTLSKGIHIMTLDCQGGNCWLTSVSLNQCGNSVGKPAFPVVVEISSTVDGRLKVTNRGDVLVVEERASDIGGDATNRFLFGYEELAPDLHRLISFSGGFVKHSPLLNQVLTVEFVPFRRAAQAVPLDCAVLVPGLELSDFDDLIESLSLEDRTAWRVGQADSGKPLLMDDARGRRLFPHYDRLKSKIEQFSDAEWEQYVKEYLREVESWLKLSGMSTAGRRRVLTSQEDALLGQIRKHEKK